MTIKEPHCKQCGSTSAEDVMSLDGYSLCCNKVIVNKCDSTCTHR